MNVKIGLIPDTSILVYYLFGNQDQKNRIFETFQKFNNTIILNEPLKSEIGRVIFASFFKFKSMIDIFLSKKENLDSDDFWITLTQKINKIWSTHLSNRLSYILTYFRNIYEKTPLNKKDTNYYNKVKDRINSSVYLLIEELLEFQDELSNWKLINTHACPQAKWELIYNENTLDYELSYNSKCSIICPTREELLLELIKEHKLLFLDILKNSNKIASVHTLLVDKKLLDTVKKLIMVNEKNQKFDFRTNYCYNLGDFLICLLLKGTNHNLYTLNIEHSKFLFHFLKIDENRLIEFTQ